MKELKFRVWDKQRQIMIYDLEVTGKGEIDYDSIPEFAVGLGGELYILREDGQYSEANDNNYVVMYFTGLLDDYSTELYEGDIVEVGYITEPVDSLTRFLLEHLGQFETEMAIVRIDKTGAWYLEGRNWKFTSDDLPLIVRLREKGTIYENPELLSMWEAK